MVVYIKIVVLIFWQLLSSDQQKVGNRPPKSPAGQRKPKPSATKTLKVKVSPTKKLQALPSM